MTATILDAEPLSAAERRSLKSRLRRAERMGRVRAYAAVAPLLAFILLAFVVPITLMLINSVQNPVVASQFPRTLTALAAWGRTAEPTPPEGVYEAFAEELKVSRKAGELSKVATRLNYDSGGMRSLLMGTARRIKDGDTGPWKERLLAVDAAWGKRETWAVFRQAGDPFTAGYYLAALDLRRDADDQIVRQPEDQRLYVDAMSRTLWVGALVTFFTLLAGYPVAYLLATLPPKTGNLLMICVLLPFWTSLLVRTTSWIVILQREGLFNDLLMALGLIDERVQLIFNRFGVVTAMTHILLPFMILPIYSVMKQVPPSLVRAARSLGAGPVTAFFKVYVPQTMPGVSAGALLVFILALGYYITPALVGGPADQMISYFIADHIGRSLNWGLASALGGVLLAGVLALYAVYDRLVGVTNVKLG
ncbi:ABC transporter permease [Aromatoleum petrolei]|uniref:ABC transporter permease subunit n=1 Tax=Aromatoleum petrolei TaxID=76116 RepID=A0ABX1MS00_9RHOO|nr:ABC transporter permease [Aromatoleum petrolei]NMF89383.1 ABC transporter permease subunit [Aromatoleum petrolei]QTQ39113.1 Putative ABC transporter, permease protein [Aromatoleum petrolei]